MRLFIAISPDDALRLQLAAIVSRLRREAVSGRFAAPELLHLTLAFLGETPDTKAAIAAMEQLHGQRFELTADRLGRFARDGGDIWWLGFSASAPLQALHRRLTALLERQGFALERRPYRPHLTLGRQVIMPPGFEPQQLPEPLRFAVGDLHLMESLREGGRLQYRALFSRPLDRSV